MSLGGLGPLALLRLWPGIGGRSSGTGAAEGEEEDILRLPCFSPGKNSSLGSAVVARSAVLLADTLTKNDRSEYKGEYYTRQSECRKPGVRRRSLAVG